MIDTKLDMVLHYSAFTRDPRGGNRAGVALEAQGWSDGEMQEIAAAIAYSETAFVVGDSPEGVHVRYFSPAAEVPFCGHATIALAVALAENRGPADRTLLTRSGPVSVRTTRTEDGGIQATLTSVTPRISEPESADLQEALDALGWTAADLHPDLPPRVAFAGASHLVLVAAHAARLHSLEFEYDRLKSLMDRVGWTTIHLAWPDRGPHEHTVRNAFPAGPVTEDPATGAGAAAYGAYLRFLGAVQPPVQLVLRQGEAMGRPSTLYVDIPAGDGGISVSGHAVSVPPHLRGA